MKQKNIGFALLLSALLLGGCAFHPEEQPPEPEEPAEITEPTDFPEPEEPPEPEQPTESNKPETPPEPEEPTEPTEPTEPEEPVEPPEPEEVLPPEETVTLPTSFVYPKTDGSTSTLPLDEAVKSAVLGGEQTSAHTKTYTSFYNLLDGKCELIFTTPLSEAQLSTMEERSFRYEAEPVCGEGFVFVVNRDNPVDSLTVEQLRGIYSGEITNWSEVGGNDAPILAYQRNADSGSQNYMISFMGDTPLMEPITEELPASMSGILDVITEYDNGIDAIGYSVFAYSDGMYENLAKIKYIKVNGVEPSLETLADGSYPLLGYNYAVFSAEEPEDSNVRALVRWMQSAEGQQTIADAGYIPYRRVAGLTLPDPTGGVLYQAVGTSGIQQPAESADYDYRIYSQLPESFTAEGLNEAVQRFISESTEELSQMDEAERHAFLEPRATYGYYENLVTEVEMVNGYLSVIVGWQYNFGYQDAPNYYYAVRTSVFDLFTGKRLELSDLFFEGADFVPLLNQYLAREASLPYSSFGMTHDLLHEFRGLAEGEFTFTADSVFFTPGSCFADGAVLSLDGIADSMVTSIPRDMTEVVSRDAIVYRELRTASANDLGYAEEKNGVTIWYLDPEKAQISAEVCEQLNGYVESIYENAFTEEKLAGLAAELGHPDAPFGVGPFPDFRIDRVGNRYFEIEGANLILLEDTVPYQQFPILPDQRDPFYFREYRNAKTGEELRVDDLFREGWIDEAEIYEDNGAISDWKQDWSAVIPSSLEASARDGKIMRISGYDAAPRNWGTQEDLEIPVFVFVRMDSGESAVICVPRIWIP